MGCLVLGPTCASCLGDSHPRRCAELGESEPPAGWRPTARVSGRGVCAQLCEPSERVQDQGTRSRTCSYLPRRALQPLGAIHSARHRASFGARPGASSSSTTSLLPHWGNSTLITFTLGSPHTVSSGESILWARVSQRFGHGKTPWGPLQGERFPHRGGVHTGGTGSLLCSQALWKPQEQERPGLRLPGGRTEAFRVPGACGSGHRSGTWLLFAP